MHRLEHEQTQDHPQSAPAARGEGLLRVGAALAGMRLDGTRHESPRPAAEPTTEAKE